MQAALQVTGLSKHINGKVILSDISFCVNEGEILALIGPNGAGKTTTMKCIINAMPKDAGEVTIFGRPFSHSMKNQIAFVSENRQVFYKATLGDYYEFYKRLYPAWNDSFFKSIISRYNFNFNQIMQSFSMGQRTLILVILALSTFSKLIFLDEPTQHLDPTIRYDIIQLIKSFVRETNTTFVISSHEIFELEEYATNIAIIKDGRILYTDTIDSAKEKHRLVKSIDSSEALSIVGMVDNQILIRTDKQIGEFPNLNQIIIGYLKGYSQELEIQNFRSKTETIDLNNI